VQVSAIGCRCCGCFCRGARLVWQCCCLEPATPKTFSPNRRPVNRRRLLGQLRAAEGRAESWMFHLNPPHKRQLLRCSRLPFQESRTSSVPFRNSQATADPFKFICVLKRFTLSQMYHFAPSWVQPHAHTAPRISSEFKPPRTPSQAPVRVAAAAASLRSRSIALRCAAELNRNDCRDCKWKP
jgi:hypothetical protein